MVTTMEEAEKRIAEIGAFSAPLQQILQFLLNDAKTMRNEMKLGLEGQKADLITATKNLEAAMTTGNDKLREIIQKENQQRKQDMMDIEAFVKKESAERRKGMNDVMEKLKSEEEKRADEAKALALKLEKEKKDLQDYLEKDARETKARLAEENTKLQAKLDKEASDLKKKLQDADEEKGEEMKIMQQKLDLERKLLNEKMEREKQELAEEMERAEQERKRDAEKLKNRMEEEAKQTQSGIVTMFERLKGENENRKTEIHGLKDILVRENEKMVRDQMALGQRLENGFEELNGKIDHGLDECRKEIKNKSDGIYEAMKMDKKEVRDKIDNEYGDLKKKIEMETNEMRDKMQMDKKAVNVRLEEMEDERQKEAKLIRTQMQREREETRDLISSEAKLIQDSLDNNTKELMDIIKKEKSDREKEVESVKRKIEDEKQELQLSIDRDRDNITKRLNEEHDQRRIEQMEVQQRLENTEKSGKNDMQELFNRVKRYEEEARLDNDEVRQALQRTCAGLDEKLSRDKKELREALEHETLDLTRRVDKCNIERMNESADVQQKLGMLGKSASRHLDQLKTRLQSEVQTLLDLMKKSTSVAFNAFRDEGLIDGGECYVTFSGCNVNIGNGMIPKSGIFQAPVPGTYMFTLTVCTYDGKKCLLFLRKNQKDVCAMIDQDGNENRGKTMITQTCMLDLEIGERVQVYAVTGTGFTDLKSSHYTQFSGLLIRPSADMYDEAAKLTYGEEDELSIRESFRGFTPTPMDIERRAASRASVSRRSVEPPPVQSNGATVNTIPMPTSVPIPQSIPLPVLKKDVKANSNNAHNTTLSPEPPAARMNGANGSNGAGSPGNSQSDPAPAAAERSKKKKDEQSYLALTGLGGGEPKPQEQKQEQKPQRKQESTNSFYSFLKR